MKTLPVMVASYLINIVIGLCSQIYGLLHWKDQAHWAKTEHGIAGKPAEVSQASALQRKVA